jgi:hypothetical protein
MVADASAKQRNQTHPVAAAIATPRGDASLLVERWNISVGEFRATVWGSGASHQLWAA